MQEEDVGQAQLQERRKPKGKKGNVRDVDAYEIEHESESGSYFDD